MLQSWLTPGLALYCQGSHAIKGTGKQTMAAEEEPGLVSGEKLGIRREAHYSIDLSACDRSRTRCRCKGAGSGAFQAGREA